MNFVRPVKKLVMFSLKKEKKKLFRVYRPVNIPNKKLLSSKKIKINKNILKKDIQNIQNFNSFIFLKSNDNKFNIW
jgi:hypothetical protein